MEKDIKYVNYEVYHSGNLSKQGTVPGIISTGSVEKQFNLGGVWLWHTCPERVTLKLWNDVHGIELTSDRSPITWWSYAESHNISVPNPHEGKT